MSASNGIPTVDEVGDEALAGSFIDRSITDIYDSTIKSVGRYAFYNCSNLATVYFQKATEIYDRAFYNCSNLATVDLPTANTIRDYAFAGCSNLTTVDLPKVTYICSYAFQNCKSLTAVILRRQSVVSLFYYAFPNTAYFYVPSALVDSYKADTIWSTYANRIRALEDYTDDGAVTGTFVPPQ